MMKTRMRNLAAGIVAVCSLAGGVVAYINFSAGSGDYTPPAPTLEPHELLLSNVQTCMTDAGLDFEVHDLKNPNQPDPNTTIAEAAGKPWHDTHQGCVRDATEQQFSFASETEQKRAPHVADMYRQAVASGEIANPTLTFLAMDGMTVNHYVSSLDSFKNAQLNFRACLQEAGFPEDGTESNFARRYLMWDSPIAERRWLGKAMFYRRAQQASDIRSECHQPVFDESVRAVRETFTALDRMG